MVFDRLKAYLGRDSGSRSLTVEEIPGFLSSREEAISLRLEEEVRQYRPRIEQAMLEIRELLRELKQADPQATVHPKVEKIARSALPQLERALLQQLDRTLSQDPEEFYRESAAVLKGSIEAMRGAGKHLPMAFPEGMKTLRGEIRTIGQAINAMNTVFTRSQEERKGLATVRELYTDLRRMDEEGAKGSERIRKLEDQIAATRVYLDELQADLTALEASEEMAGVEREKIELLNRERELAEARLRDERVRAIALSVYRRALRITRHQGGQDSMLEGTIEVLESTPRDCEEIHRSLTISLTPVFHLVQDQELALKGQDEERLFSDAAGAARRIRESCQEVLRAEEEVLASENRIKHTAVVSRQERLKITRGEEEENLSELSDRLEKERHNLATLPVRRGDLRLALSDALARVRGEGPPLRLANE